jgi:hypothetical protein
MPLYNGTGPFGFGPGSGGRKGRCKGNLELKGFGTVINSGKSRLFIALAAPVMIAVVRDFINPSGFLRQCVRALLSDKKNMNPQILREAPYSVLEKNVNDGLTFPKICPGKSKNGYI